MGRASRFVNTRAVEVKPLPGAKPVPKSRKNFLAGTLALAVIAIPVVAVLVVTMKPTPLMPPATSVSAEDLSAPASLVTAARDVGFFPTTLPGLGKLENEPASAARGPSNRGLLRPGTKAPPFTLRTPTGRTVSLSDFRGKAVLLEFFATWCPHCNVEAAHLRALSKALPSSKVAFVSINGDGETAPSVFAYHLYHGLDFPALLDPSSSPGSFKVHGSPGPVSKAYAGTSYPTFYVIDPKGRVAWAGDGEQPDALLRQQLVKAAGVRPHG
jgi:peroxiredoxin